MSSATISPTPTPPLSLLVAAGEHSTWIASVTGITSGTLLVGLGLVLTVVLCRKRQIRKERLLREHLYYTIGDRPPNPVAEPAENPNDQLITLTNYVNLPQVEPATTKSIDIPGMTRNVADTVTNSAYSAGVHYDRIPGEPDSKPASAASEHLYSVIKDEAASAKKKEAPVQPTQKQKKQKKVSKSGSKADQAEGEKAIKGASTLLGGAMAQPVDMEGEGFIELLPRNTQAYDSLKHEGHQEIQELSIVLTSGAYDQLHSPEEEKTDKKLDKQEYIFNPYGGESDNESSILQEDVNPYDDTVGIKSQLSSLQAITNGQSSDSRDKHDTSASSEKLNNKKPLNFQVDESSEMTHAYDAIDELQKQIHILSQSIPTLDLYGYEDLDKIKPAPKASRSIPVLDVVGYEDLDATKPAQKMNYADVDFDNHFYESITEKKVGRHSLGAVLDVDESPPSVPARTIASMYTAVQKKPKSSTMAAHAATGGEKENKAKKLEVLCSTSKKSSSTTNLSEAPPPVPPLTVEAFYTAVQKPKKKSTGAMPAKGGPPPLPPKGDTEENSSTLPPKTVASMYTTVQKRPKATGDTEENAPTVPPTTIASMYTAVQKRPKANKKATDTEVPTFEFEVVPPPPLPPKSAEEAYLAAQKEGKTPPIPPRAHERVYSGVYRHKEEKLTVL